MAPRLRQPLTSEQKEKTIHDRLGERQVQTPNRLKDGAADRPRQVGASDQHLVRPWNLNAKRCQGDTSLERTYQHGRQGGERFVLKRDEIRQDVIWNGGVERKSHCS